MLRKSTLKKANAETKEDKVKSDKEQKQNPK